jgi:O-acetyl-ADP-ribose deacetylase (regulator of RNase III)
MIKLVKGDITELDVDCIVNAANSSLLRGGGVCGAIFKKDGPELDKACNSIGFCDVGSAVMTPTHNLPQKWICHAVGPIYSGSPEDSELLKGAYQSSLELAEIYHCKSIAFPCISCGIFGYPIEEACEIAFNTIKHFDNKNGDMTIVICCFDDTTYDIYKRWV